MIASSAPAARAVSAHIWATAPGNGCHGPHAAGAGGLCHAHADLRRIRQELEGNKGGLELGLPGDVVLQDRPQPLDLLDDQPPASGEQMRRFASFHAKVTAQGRISLCSEQRGAGSEGAVLQAGEALDAVAGMEADAARGRIGEAQRMGRAVGEAVAAVRAGRSASHVTPDRGLVHRDGNGRARTRRPARCPPRSPSRPARGTRLLGGYLRAEDVHHEAVVLHEMVDDGLLGLALRGNESMSFFVTFITSSSPASGLHRLGPGQRRERAGEEELAPPDLVGEQVRDLQRRRDRRRASPPRRSCPARSPRPVLSSS